MLNSIGKEVNQIKLFAGSANFQLYSAKAATGKAQAGA
jgi:hypothetical protein